MNCKKCFYKMKETILTEYKASEYECPNRKCDVYIYYKRWDSEHGVIERKQ